MEFKLDIGEPQSLHGRLAIVTGATRGIGQAITLYLLNRGCSVLGTYLDSPLSTSLSRDRPRVVGVAADVRNPATSVPLILATLEKEFPGKQVDILVNNAGVSPLKPLHSETLESMTETLTANVTFPTLLLGALLPRLSKTGTGRVVNVSSEGSHLGRANTSAYSASKAALESLTRTWARELGREHAGLTANSLCLGLTETGLFEALPAARKEFWRARVEEENAVAGRLGTPEEVAEVVGFLVGDAGGWISGQCIAVGGGGLMIV